LPAMYPVHQTRTKASPVADSRWRDDRPMAAIFGPSATAGYATLVRCGPTFAPPDGLMTTQANAKRINALIEIHVPVCAIGKSGARIDQALSDRHFLP
jgi:hypothetical protein